VIAGPSGPPAVLQVATVGQKRGRPMAHTLALAAVVDLRRPAPPPVVGARREPGLPARLLRPAVRPGRRVRASRAPASSNTSSAPSAVSAWRFGAAVAVVMRRLRHPEKPRSTSAGMSPGGWRGSSFERAGCTCIRRHGGGSGQSRQAARCGGSAWSPACSGSELSFRSSGWSWSCCARPSCTERLRRQTTGSPSTGGGATAGPSSSNATRRPRTAARGADMGAVSASDRGGRRDPSRTSSPGPPAETA
jgi:hypothetical protein